MTEKKTRLLIILYFTKLNLLKLNQSNNIQVRVLTVLTAESDVNRSHMMPLLCESVRRDQPTIS